MPELPGGGTIVVVDTLPLRTVGLMTVLDKLTEPKRSRVASLTPDEAEQFFESHSRCGMIIYNVGGGSVADHRHARLIKSLRGRAESIPLVILSDSDNRKEVVAAFTAGAQGYLHAGTKPQQALQALSLIARGGSYFPPNGPARHRRSTKVDPPISEGVHPARSNKSAERSAPAEADTAASIGEDSRADLTERQRAVLALLGRGESNKGIARRLNIREGTVKVHVRHIMRRMGAANRTQVAIAASRGDEWTEGSPPGLRDEMPQKPLQRVHRAKRDP